MLKIYCSDCGGSNEYSTAKPNFCQKCGQKFSHANIQGNKVKVTIDENEEDRVSVPINLEGLEIEFEEPRRNNTMTLESLVKTGSPHIPPQKLDARSNPNQGRNVIAEFKKEAGSLRQGKPDK